LRAGVYGFILCVMLSRVVIGAHYLTDVTFGVGMTFFSFWFIVIYSHLTQKNRRATKIL